MSGETKGGTGFIGTDNNGDGGIGQGYAGVGGSDLGIIPFGDFAQENFGIYVPGEFKVFNTGQVVGNNNLTCGHGQQLNALGDLVDFTLFHGCVTGTEIHGVGNKIFDAGTGTDGLVVHFEITVGCFGKIFEPFTVNWCRKACTRTGNFH